MEKKDKRKHEELDTSGKSVDSLAALARMTTLGVIGVLRQTIGWWIRIPAKLFRPSSVSPWLVITSLAKTQNTPLSISFVVKTFKSENGFFFFRNVLPLLAVNYVAGMTLFHTYTASHSMLLACPRRRVSTADQAATYAASGALAGLAQSLIVTPFAQITKQIDPVDLANQTHLGIHRVAHNTLVGMPKGTQYVRFLYMNFRFHAVRDMVAYGLFFCAFESLLALSPSGDKKTSSIGPVIGAGATAGLLYQSVVYPLDRVAEKCQTEHITWRYVFKTMFGSRQRLVSMYNGFGYRAIQSIPASAVALVVYEYLK